LLRWANFIFCMEKAHLQKLRERFSEELAGRSLASPGKCDAPVFLSARSLPAARSLRH
jgi:predicted protein tyrosine phosphatase